MANHLLIGNVIIRQDHEGRFCINDLHQAAGGERRHQPSNWLSNQQTKSLIEEIERQSLVAGNAPVEAVASRQKIGTFVTKDMVYSYAMWVSPAFQLQVIRAYDNLKNALNPAITLPDFNDPVAAARAWADKAEEVRKLARLAHEQSQHLEAARPALEFHTAVAEAGDTMSIGQFAKLMNIGEVRLFGLLRNEKVLISGGAKHNLPFQHHIEVGRFVVRETVHKDRETGRTHLRCQTRVTPKGQMWLQQKFFPTMNQALDANSAQLLGGESADYGEFDRDVPALQQTYGQASRSDYNCTLAAPVPEPVPAYTQNKDAITLQLARQSLEESRKMLRRPVQAKLPNFEDPSVPLPHPEQDREASRYRRQSYK